MKLKNQELTKLKNKQAALLEESKAKKEQKSDSLLKQVLAEKQTDFDERRVLILKGQNTQLTKQNAFLQELTTKQSKLCIDISSVLQQAITQSKDTEYCSEFKSLLVKLKSVHKA